MLMSLLQKNSISRRLYSRKNVIEETSNVNVSVPEEILPEETENVDVSTTEATFNAEEISIHFL